MYKKFETVEDAFAALPSYRKMNGGSTMTYLRIGKGLFTGKAWADYVDEEGHRYYLKNKFYPTVLEALQALHDAWQNSIPRN